MKIRSVHLRNFQSHADTRIELAPGLTVLTGPSDSGKSAILRALRWVYWNQPPGLEILRAGASQVSVEVELEDGTRVRRERSASVNRYVIERPGEPPQVLEGFGRDVPEPVLEALGIRNVHLGGRDLWLGYAGQLEPHFLIAEPGAVQAEAIGRLTGVHVLGQAAVAVRRDEQAAEREASRLAQEMEEIRAELEGYADLPAEEARVTAAEACLDRATRLEERVARLEMLGRQLEDIRREAAAVRRLLDRFRGVPAAERLIERAAELARRREALLRLATSLDDVRRQKLDVHALLARTDGIGVVERLMPALQARVGRLERLQRLAGEWEDVRRQREALQQRLRRWAGLEPAARAASRAQALAERLGRLVLLAQQWQELSAERSRLEALAADARNREARLAQTYQDTLARLGVCPTCGQPVGRR